jgi:hypothetical protein
MIPTSMQLTYKTTALLLTLLLALVSCKNTPKADPPNMKIALDEKGEARAREIQILVNVIMPDETLQPFYLSDHASAFEIYNHREDLIRKRLEGYFGKPFTLNIRQPLWSLVDQIKEAYPGWPDEWD